MAGAIVSSLAGPGWAQSAEPEYLVAQRPPGRPGGELVVALRAEPQTFNPVLAVDNPSRIVTEMLTATLIFVNRESQEGVAALAKTWTVSDDGRQIDFELRRGLRFSDGHPFDADDVVFTFQVHLDKDVGSIYYGNLIVGGEPIKVRKTGPYQVELRLAEADAEGARLIDSVPVLPRHRLEKPFREGRFSEVWDTGSEPRSIIGLGPFRVSRYLPGERLELERNPHYWKVDGNGQKLPYFDSVTILFVADEEARTLRFQSGQTHLIERLNGRTFNRLAKVKAPPYLVRDLGPGLDFSFLFFNLNDVDAASYPEIAVKQSWFRRVEFRKAVSMAIDRPSITRLVYALRATPTSSHITAGNRRWVDPDLEQTPYAPDRARALLKTAGFTWDKAQRLKDSQGRPVTFSIMVNSGNHERASMASILQEDLRRLGVEIQVRTLEFQAFRNSLMQTFEFEACILGFPGGIDPNHYISMWRSDGNLHLWRLRSRGEEPAWQVDLNRLMHKQRAQLDYAMRKKTYRQVQAILGEYEPFVVLVSPNVLVGAHRGIGNFAPSILGHSTLWNVDELYWKDNGSAARR